MHYVTVTQCDALCYSDNIIQGIILQCYIVTLCYSDVMSGLLLLRQYDVSRDSDAILPM